MIQETHVMHDNSLFAYEDSRSKSLFGERARLIYDWLKDNGAATDREIKEALGFAEMNCIRPRISELIKSGKVVEIGSTRDRLTGKTVRIVGAV